MTVHQKKCVLVLGGARSGKSSFAQRLAIQLGKKVLFVATAAPLDDEMKHRIEMHKKSRPKSWRTLEVLTDVGKEIEKNIQGVDVVILDCLTLLISNVFEKYGSKSACEELLEKKVETEIMALISCIKNNNASFIIVTNEVGSGIVPANKVSRIFRDVQGRANQELARIADSVYLMVAGLPLEVKP